MSFPTSDEVNRIKAYQLITRLEQDPALAERARANPRLALAEAGISAETIDELLGTRVGDMSAPAEDDDMSHCTDTTCWSSDCPGTCYLTIITDSPEPVM
ncbi:hypothetical protein [Pseudofrankia sp. DC12]|uniref:hypothetical protein n=1 Tax=Pseudofrankia sp. DC12 TaxID=683315 RepID=UPI0005F7B1DD|nr:hypothetical protein [Pseudofrankia sp. DC12]